MLEIVSKNLTRRALLSAFSACAITAAPTYANAAGFLRGSGDIRKLSLYSRRSGERVDTIYWIDGEYVKEAVREISRIMRDWRRNEIRNIDLRTIDLMAASHSILDTSEPFQLLSGYRSPQTNAMLRRRSRLVAKKSLHMSGQAADLRMGSRSARQISHAALSCKAGGVGTYSRSNFVHMDCGPLRAWGR